MSFGVSISYLILVHDDPLHFRALLRRLATTSVRFHVHVDAKRDITPFRRAAMDVPGVHFCEPRVDVTWAAFSVVEATLRLIDAALADGHTSGRLVLLSGADYPIATNAEIADFFARHSARQFIRRFAIADADEVQQWKVRGRHFREFAPRYSWSRVPLFSLERALRLFPRSLPREWPLMCGSQWWGLTADCAAYCVGVARSRPDVVRFFRRVFAPDEIFFHTMVQHSPFRGTAEPVESFNELVTRSGSLAHYANLHHLPGKTISDVVDAHTALSTGPDRLFARKFSSRESAEAIRVIDESLDIGPAAELRPMEAWVPSGNGSPA